MASCAFSVDIDSINNPSSPLITHATKLFRFSKLLFAFQGTLIAFHWHSFLYFDTSIFCDLNDNCVSSFPTQAVFPFFFLSWSCWVSPFSPSLLPRTSKHFWRRSQHNEMAAHVRFGQQHTAAVFQVFSLCSLCFWHCLFILNSVQAAQTPTVDCWQRT